MLKQIYIENGVKHHNKTIVFEKGLTSITGANGAGKSLVQEFIRFALFGVSALRGKIENYHPDFRVTLDLEVNAKAYTIKRTLSDCSFNGVTGTKACNKAIIETLGYDMTVFDIGNCAKQFEITKLGDMTPTERKQAVDQVLGLTVVDKLIKEVQESASELKGEVAGIEGSLISPEAPEPPLMPYTEAQLIEEIRIQGEIEKKLSALKAYDTFKAPEVPIPFVLETPLGDPSFKDEFFALIAQRKSLGECPILPDYSLEYLKEQEVKTRAWAPFENEKQPSYKKAFIEAQIELHERLGAWEKRFEIECPACQHKFNLEGLEKPETPAVSLAELKSEFLLCIKWENAPQCDRPERKTTYAEILELERNLEKIKQIKETKDKIKRIPPCDYDAWAVYVNEKTRYENRVATYNTMMAAYEDMLKSKAIIGGELTELQIGDRIDNPSGYLQALKVYEAKQEAYKKQVEIFEAKCELLKAKKKDLESKQAAVKGLRNFKNEVKLYVIPSLSRVASDLMSEMTDGVWNKVEITEDFDIQVSGKDLRLLSGSEKAVANLAIRIGLGRVLTHKVFNVFMGDEIDESMSEDRAEKVAGCLARLVNQIDQIILISHRNIEANHNITV